MLAGGASRRACRPKAVCTGQLAGNRTRPASCGTRRATAVKPRPSCMALYAPARLRRAVRGAGVLPLQKGVHGGKAVEDQVGLDVAFLHVLQGGFAGEHQNAQNAEIAGRWRCRCTGGRLPWPARPSEGRWRFSAASTMPRVGLADDQIGAAAGAGLDKGA